MMLGMSGHQTGKRRLSGRANTPRSRKYRKHNDDDVKLEMPDVDLNAPMPPPSPGDDPLLLSGELQPSSPFSESDIPVYRPPPPQTSAPFRRTVSPPGLSSSGLHDEDPPLFHLLNPDQWSNSDDSDSGAPLRGSPAKRGEGEFTGKFLEVLVKTKKDEWRNPKKFFPLSLEKSPFPLSREKRWPDSPKTSLASSPPKGPSAEDAFRLMGNSPFDMNNEQPLHHEEFPHISHHGDGEELLHHEPSYGDEPSLEGELSYHDESSCRDEPSYPKESSHHEQPSHHEEEPPYHEEGLSYRDEPLDLEELSHPEQPTHDEEDLSHHEQPIRDKEEPSYHEEEPSCHEEERSCHDEPSHHDEVSSYHEEVPSYHSVPPDRDDVTPHHDEPLQPDEEPSYHNEISPHHDDEALHPDNTVDSPLQHHDDATTPFETEISIQVEHDSSDQDFLSGSETWASPALVRITSADPRAAARAAAILKKHNYDCFTRREMKKRYSDISRRRTLSPAPIISARGVLSGAIEKQKRDLRRRTIAQVMGVRGEKVYIPGSPTTTLPKLLKQAEQEVSLVPSSSPNPFLVMNPYNSPPPAQVLPPRSQGPMTTLVNKMNTTLVLTPKVPMTPGKMCYDPLSGTRMWTKEEWKRLDACFTDERLQVGMRMGLRGDDSALVQGTIDGWEKWEGMASVDQVDLDNVVARFVDWMGGWDEVDGYGPQWSKYVYPSNHSVPVVMLSRKNLISRTKALRNKQRKGKVAPPTSLPFSPSTALAAMSLVSPSPADASFTSMVPEFTPIRRTVGPGVLKKRREWASIVGTDTDKGEPSQPMPRSLLAPRYSHLWDAASKNLPQATKGSEGTSQEEADAAHSDASVTTSTLVEEERELVPASEPSEPDHDKPTTIGKRVKGILFSYLPTLGKTPKSKSKNQKWTGLPLPPEEVLSKPRGPVATPAKAPITKTIHPKELVHLQQTPPIPPIASKIPRVVHPKQLVELHHVVPKAEGEEEWQIRESGSRRSSSAASVKDLILEFEQMEKEVVVERGRELKRMKSVVGNWRREGVRGRLSGEGEDGQPAWRP